MKKLTMVMRCGDAKSPAEALMYTLIGEDYSFTRLTGADIVSKLASKTIEVTNMGVENGKLVSTNGALKNYTLVDMSGNLANEIKAVILNRVENEKGLLGYTVYGLNGTLQEMNVPTAVELAKAGKIANGKIRHTQQGDIVASIGGLYPLRTLKMQDTTDDKITVDLLFMGSALDGTGRASRYAGVIVNSKNAATVSKLYKKLSESNKTVVDKITAVSHDSNIADTLGMKVTGTAGFYGIYSLDTVYSLIEKANNTVSLPMGKLMIACTDYTDPDHIESNITLTPDLKPAGRQDGTNKGVESLKTYTKSILEKFKEAKITIK